MLEEGTKLKMVFWPGDGERIEAGVHGCTSIEVSMQPGQMGRVPFVLTTHEDGRRFLYNLAHADGVQLAHDPGSAAEGGE